LVFCDGSLLAPLTPRLLDQVHTRDLKSQELRIKLLGEEEEEEEEWELSTGTELVLGCFLSFSQSGPVIASVLGLKAVCLGSVHFVGMTSVFVCVCVCVCVCCVWGRGFFVI
jgi:hypothetical protein